MNYSDHYSRLIERAKGRDLLGYKERHHILPRCIGGNNAEQNIVNLTPEEHFVAHCLLVKMYPKHYGIASAANLMAGQRNNNKSYGWIRRHWALAKTGTKQKDETKQKISNSLKGRVFSSDHKRKISDGLKGKIKSHEHIVNMSTSHIGKKPSPEAREKMRNATRPPVTDEHRRKLSLARRGQKPFLGKKHSLETIEKMRAYHERKRELSKGNEF